MYSTLRYRNYTIVLTCIGNSGNYDCAAATSAVVYEYKPKVVILMGIAAGIRNKIKIGQIVLGEKVGYESAAIETGKNGKEIITHRPEMIRIVHPIQQDVASYLGSLKYNRIERKFAGRVLKGTYPTPSEGKEKEYHKHVAKKAKIVTAAIPSGEKLLKN